MAKKKRNRRQYRGRDSSLPPQTIRIEAQEKSKLQNWWSDHKQTVLIRLAQTGLILLVYGLIRLV